MQNGIVAAKRFCPNCGCLLNGFLTEEQRIRFDCPQCKLVSVVVKKTRRGSTVHEHLPKYWEMLQEGQGYTLDFE